MKRIPRQVQIFGLFFLSSLILYWPARNAGFVSDFLGWQDLYDKGPWYGFLYSFGYGGHQQVLQLINYCMYKAFGTNGLPWTFLFCAFHAANGYLLYRLLLKMGNIWQLQFTGFTAMFGALFFLFSPYQPEVTVWRVCLHYMISGLCTLGAIWYTLDYLQKGRVRALWWAHGLMLINLFTLELALAIPLLTHGVLIGWQLSHKAPSVESPDTHDRYHLDWKKTILYLSLPQIGLYIFFFVWNKLTLGQWVGHYGEKRMLAFDPVRMLSTPLKYMVKPLFFIRHWEHADKMALFNWMSGDFGIKFCYILLISMALSVFFLRNFLTPRIKLAVLLLWLGILASVPVSNLHFEWVLFNENDRYGYVSSLFVLPVMALALARLARWWKYFAALLYLFISSFLLRNTVNDWAEMDRIYHKLLDEFVWYDAKELYVLSLADNYQGIWMFRYYPKGSALADAFQVVKHRNLSGIIHETAFFNMNTGHDALSAKVLEGNTLRVEFEQWGNWWWLSGLGANDYETDDFAIDFQDKWYDLRLKRLNPEAVYIYQSGDHWKTLEMPKR